MTVLIIVSSVFLLALSCIVAWPLFLSRAWRSVLARIFAGVLMAASFSPAFYFMWIVWRSGAY